jgi:hypothetical protein
MRTYGNHTSLVTLHAARFEIVNSFFNSYNQQAIYYSFDNESHDGYCGVAEYIKKLMKDNQFHPGIYLPATDFPDPVIQWFIAELQNELADFRQTY